jgi:hypothetical protein
MFVSVKGEKADPDFSNSSARNWCSFTATLNLGIEREFQSPSALGGPASLELLLNAGQFGSTLKLAIDHAEPNLVHLKLYNFTPTCQYM